MHNTNTYLSSLVQKIGKEYNPSIITYKTLISEFAHRSNFLIANLKLVIKEHTCIVLFLQDFLDKIGDKLCKRYKIDIDVSICHELSFPLTISLRTASAIGFSLQPTSPN